MGWGDDSTAYALAAESLAYDLDKSDAGRVMAYAERGAEGR
jgi:hypothetical protein